MPWRRCTPGPRAAERCRRPSTPPRRSGPGSAAGPDGEHDVWVAERTARWSATRWPRVPGSTTCSCDPDAQGRGVGGALLDLVKGVRPAGLLPVGLRDQHPPARSTAAAGSSSWSGPTARATRRSAPDVRMAWPGPDPVAFFRRPDRRGRRAAGGPAGPAGGADPRGAGVKGSSDRRRTGAGRSPRRLAVRRRSWARPAGPDRARDHHRESRRRDERRVIRERVIGAGGVGGYFGGRPCRRAPTSGSSLAAPPGGAGPWPGGSVRGDLEVPVRAADDPASLGRPTTCWSPSSRSTPTGSRRDRAAARADRGRVAAERRRQRGAVASVIGETGSSAGLPASSPRSRTRGRRHGGPGGRGGREGGAGGAGGGLRRAAVEVEESPDIRVVLWSKFAVICPAERDGRVAAAHRGGPRGARRGSVPR